MAQPRPEGHCTCADVNGYGEGMCAYCGAMYNWYLCWAHQTKLNTDTRIWERSKHLPTTGEVA